ncbi:MAG TPA: tetratricopeptide repeat protein [Spirochaetota bacterium]|jgi:tetratricopeptide (TPR) repeat protein|nr:tetratricopeptide repeat protein [Spirochaetota bacterium]OQA96410.1 MAG: formate-dependent nitrite reductase complex subunit NrfG [Spirochaetes bacterium ADurb.Bin218]HOK01919.1 tetratricopeptide repeat protein [Spirochaetota bacterium]HOK92068.1 tetratricopeptide repeat protein [Spirochaetota bacterium]HON15669.1 tetratricopeptide repeat protein [Spirochaetota bacterium]
MRYIKFFASISLSIMLALPLPAISKEDEQFLKAQKYFFQKKFEMAELLLQEVIKSNPENALAYSYLGDIYLKKQLYDGALNLYKKAVDLDPGNALNHFRMGQVYYFKKMGHEALESYHKALELDSKLKITYYQIGLTYLMLLRDKEKTVENWEIYIKEVPEDPQYESIKRVIALLKDPDFKIPPADSEISIEEALLLGGATLDKKERETENRKAEHESKKSKKTLEDIYIDDDL